MQTFVVFQLIKAKLREAQADDWNMQNTLALPIMQLQTVQNKTLETVCGNKIALHGAY